jgi:hypothetical protein
MEGHPVLNRVYESWISHNRISPVLRGNEIKNYYEVLRPQMAFPDYHYGDVQYGYFFFFTEGGVYAWTDKEMKEKNCDLPPIHFCIKSYLQTIQRPAAGGASCTKSRAGSGIAERRKASVPKMHCLNYKLLKSN